MPSALVPAAAVLPNTLFVVPIQTTPVFPGMMAPLVLTKKAYIETLEQAVSNHGYLGLVLLREPSDASTVAGPVPLSQDLHRVGVVVRVLRRLNGADGTVTVLVHSLRRFQIKTVVRESPFKVVQVEYGDDVIEKSIELDALTRSVIGQVKKLSETNPFFTEEMKLAMLNAGSPGTVADLVAFAMGLKPSDGQELLETFDVKRRFERLLFHLKREQEVSDVQTKINDEVSQKIHKMQREFFLREQLRTIKRELGGEDGEVASVEKFREKIEGLALTDEARRVAREELHRLETTPETSPEHNVIRNYLDWMLGLPWGKKTDDNLDLRHARKILDEDHHGIEKVKQRILEHLAVRKLNPKSKGAVLCLVGPPGVGKTSLGKSIARAMGRSFFRFSLGGMRDEAEIKGHRRTYVGAMPGKILGALKRAGSSNPVLLLDEVDKLGASFQGDPASALLEVLDPEQNQSFLDHYLDVAFDLSDVLFVVTANTTATIPVPLLDRMEIVELSGYTLEEKCAIARKHVIPREVERHGLRANFVRFSEPALSKILSGYSREPGMRTLQQQIAAICRKVAAEVVENPKRRPVTVTPKSLYGYLGPEKFESEVKRRADVPGVVVGLAWTPMGGQILFVEATDVPRSPVPSGRLDRIAARDSNPRESSGYGQFKLTGQLGDVMTESAAIAYSYVKKATRRDRRAREFFEKNDIHLHLPAGAIPKDGPSAGITMATALLSLVTGRPARADVAMTGELSLVGKVMPVGGIREKVLAAERAGIREVILPKANRKDVRELPVKTQKKMKFRFVDRVEEAFRIALYPSR